MLGDCVIACLSQLAIVALFDTLYPTWRLKHSALNSLLASVTQSTGDSAVDIGRARLLGVIMNALSSRSDIAMFLETAGDTSAPAPAPSKEYDGTGTHFVFLQLAGRCFRCCVWLWSLQRPYRVASFRRECFPPGSFIALTSCVTLCAVA